MFSKLTNLGIFSILFFSSMVFFKDQFAFEFYVNYIPLILLLFVFIFKYSFPSQIMYLFVPLLIFGLINIFFDNNTLGDFFKIYINIFVGVLFFYYVFEYYERDVVKFLSIYFQFCILAVIICTIQLISYNINFKLGYHYNWLGFNKWGLSKGGFLGLRVNGFFSEPSYVASTLGPAFFISIYNLIFNKSYFVNRIKSIFIVIIYFLTFSSVAYLGMFFTLVLILINIGFVRYLLLIIPLVLILYFSLYNNVNEFKNRVDGLSALYIDNILEKEGTDQFSGGVKQQQKQKVNLLGKIHGSSFVQYNNYIITKENFKNNPIFGTGLGSHGIAFKKYNLNAYIGNEYRNNASDANSMLMRIISETGLFGLIFMYLFIRNNFIKRDPENTYSDYHWLISNAVLIIILLQLARQGNYTYGGFMAYMWLYYYTKKDYFKKIEEHETKMKIETENSISTQTKLE